MDEYVNRQCKVIWILFGHPRSYKKKKIGPVFILLSANNDTRQRMTRINQQQNRHNLQRKNIDENNRATHGNIYLLSDKIIYHLPDSAEEKARCGLNSWVGIETQKDSIYLPTCNIFCVCSVTVYFILMLILQR